MSKSQEGQSLEKLRSRIDELDSELLKLLNERAECVIKIGKIKQKEKKRCFSSTARKRIDGPLTCSQQRSYDRRNDDLSFSANYRYT